MNRLFGHKSMHYSHQQCTCGILGAQHTILVRSPSTLTFE